jgi:hypothetical protein
MMPFNRSIKSDQDRSQTTKYMSMRENPGSGYIVKLEDLTAALCRQLTAEEQQKFLAAIEAASGDQDEMLDLARSYSEKQNLPAPASVFLLAEEDANDGDMERGKWYVTFDQADLFERKPKAAFQLMQQLKVEPTFHNWAQWG